jgi:SAM-dependent methyltransferase
MKDSTVAEQPAEAVFRTHGHCPICAKPALFTAYKSWFRDYFVCMTCGSLPRERALMDVLNSWHPKWRDVTIHESSPSNRAASAKLQEGCGSYIATQFLPELALGTTLNGMRNENLECLTFSDESIDLHITQDVFEHVLDPAAAFCEIARTLRPGGLHIFTVPLTQKVEPSRVRARRTPFGIRHYYPEQYHGNPVGDGRSLVTTDWGYDICDHIFRSSGLFTHVIQIDNMEKGLRAAFLEVLVTIKPSV